MFNSIFKIFEKKAKKEDLEKAKQLGLITEGEFLRLTSERADDKLKNYLLKNKKKK